MMTVKQIERTWSGPQYERLYRDLVAFRPEANLKPEPESGWAAPGAAMGIIWMDEQSQSYAPLYSTLVKALLTTQQTDGSWGDLVTTALCTRALLCGEGQGVAIERGLAFLSNLQKDEGIWPRVALRRMPEDAEVSAAILAHLGDQAAFAGAVRLADAVGWFEANRQYLDQATQRVWERVARRVGRRVTGARLQPMWS